jgi:cell division protein FtsW
METHIKQHPGSDAILAGTVAILVLIGIVMVFSSSAIYAMDRHQDSYYFLKRQSLWAVLGLAALLIAWRIDCRWLEKCVYPIMAVTFTLLVIVMLTGLGKEAGGARRWVSIGPVHFQPSELAKLSIVLYMAKSLVKRQDRLHNFLYGYLPNVIVLGVFFLMILLQPDFGSATLTGAVAFCMLFVAGIRSMFLAWSVVAVIPFLALAVMGAEYRTRRILSFLDPWQDPADTGFQAIQSFVAFGRGGYFGLGLGNSKQKLFYLPEAHTDFIFSVIGEEIGLIGTLGLVFLFAVLIWRGFSIALRAQDPFAMHLAIGLTLLIGVQAFTNMGVASGILPTKGLALPFISMGGSSLVISMFSIGVLLNISEHTHRANH